MTHYTKLKQDAELEKYLKNLIRYEEALYDPDSRKKLFITDGCCIKGECLYSTSKGKMKVLLPENLRSDFQREIPLQRIGKIVVCLAHFFFVDQMFYVKNGFFPKSVRLMRKGENNHKIEKEIPTPPPHNGFKASLRAIEKDEDWENHLDKLPDTALVCPATSSRSSSPDTSPQPNSSRQKKYRKTLSANDRFTRNLSFAQLPSNMCSPVAEPAELKATVSPPTQFPVSEIHRATRKRPFAKLGSCPVAVSSVLQATVSDPIKVPASEIHRATRKPSFAKLESSPDVGTSGLQLTVSHPIPVPVSEIHRATRKRPFAQVASSPASLIAETSGLQPMPSNLASPDAVSSGLQLTVSNPIQVPVSEIHRATRKHPFAKLESSPDVGPSELKATVFPPIPVSRIASLVTSPHPKHRRYHYNFYIIVSLLVRLG
jgi:hypothetical protein